MNKETVEKLFSISAKLQQWVWLMIIVVLLIGFVIGFCYRLKGIIVVTITLVISFAIAIILRYPAKGLSEWIIQKIIERLGGDSNSWNSSDGKNQIASFASAYVIPVIALILSCIFFLIIDLPVLSILRKRAKRKNANNTIQYTEETYQIPQLVNEEVEQSQYYSKPGAMAVVKRSWNFVSDNKVVKSSLFKRFLFGGLGVVMMIPGSSLVTNTVVWSKNTNDSDQKSFAAKWTDFGVSVALVGQGKPAYEIGEMIKDTSYDETKYKADRQAMITIRVKKTNENGEVMYEEKQVPREEAYPDLARDENTFKTLLQTKRILSSPLIQNNKKELSTVLSDVVDMAGDIIKQSNGDTMPEIKSEEVDKFINDLEQNKDILNDNDQIPEEAKKYIDVYKFFKNEIYPEAEEIVDEVFDKVIDSFSGGNINEEQKNKLKDLLLAN